MIDKVILRYDNLIEFSPWRVKMANDLNHIKETLYDLFNYSAERAKNSDKGYERDD